MELFAANRGLIELWTCILAVDWVAKINTGVTCNSSTCLLPVLVLTIAVLMMNENHHSQW